MDYATLKPYLLFILTLTGAFALYVYARLQKQTTFSILKAFNIGIGPKARPSVIVLDAFLTAIVGAILSFFAVEPTTNAQAIAAGLAFTGVLNSTGIGLRNEQ